MKLRIKKIITESNGIHHHEYIIQKEIKILFFKFWINIWTSLLAKVSGFCNPSYDFYDQEVYNIALNYLKTQSSPKKKIKYINVDPEKSYFECSYNVISKG